MKQLLILACMALLQLPILAQSTTDTAPKDTITNHCAFGITTQVKNPTCPGDTDGSIAIAVASPIASITYHWLGLQLPLTANIATNLKPDTYHVIVSNLLCNDTVQVNLQAPPAIRGLSLDTALCGIGGVIDLLQKVEGGNGGFSIASAKSEYGTAFDCVNCATSQVTVDSSSYYTMQVKDRNGCTANRTVRVDVLDSLKTNATVVDETCTENGAITMRTIGGSGNYLYALNNSDAYQQEATFRKLRGNTDYAVKVLDLKGCRIQKNVRVGYTPQFTPATLAVEDVTCKGSKNGIIQVQPSSTNNITGYSLNSLSTTGQQSPNFQNLPPGDYKVFVLEGPDCYVAYAASIAEPDPITVQASVSDPNCPGQPGSVELAAEGGNGGYRYSINDAPFQARNIFENLRAGNYKIVVQDRKGCEVKDVFTVNDAQSPPIEAKVTASCPSDSSGAIVIVEGGKLLYGNYLFSLDSIHWQQQDLFEGLAPGQYTVYVWYPNGCIYKVIAVVPAVNAPSVFLQLQHVSCPGATDGSVVVQITNGNTTDFLYSLDGETYITRNSFKDLSAGTYDIYLRDSVDCVYGYEFTIEEPATPNINFQTQNISCYGEKDGQIAVKIASGEAPFSYALNNANFTNDSIFKGLGALPYTVLVRDANGCFYSKEVTLSEPPQGEIMFTTVNETCGNKNGVIVGFPSGGTPGYHYFWNLGDTTAVITGLPAGQYALTVTDKNNCKYVADTTIGNLPGPLVLGEISDVPCHGAETGAIQLTIIGGSEPLGFKWSNGLRSPKIYNLAAGDYTVTVSDAHQCVSIKTFNLYEPAPIELDAQTGTSGGLWFINLLVEGGVAPYQYIWSNGEISEDIFNLTPGIYTVTVIDKEGCSQKKSVSVGTTATIEPDWAQYVNIYPNPVQQKLNIIIDLPVHSENMISLFDVTGRQVLPSQVAHDQHIQLNMESLPAGVYILRIDWKKQWLYRKIVKS